MSRRGEVKPSPRAQNWLLFPSQTMDRGMNLQQDSRSHRRLPFNLQAVFNPATAHEGSQYEESFSSSAEIKDIPLYRERPQKTKKFTFGRSSPHPHAPEFPIKQQRRASLNSFERVGDVSTLRAISPDPAESSPPRRSAELSLLRSLTPDPPTRPSFKERREVSFYEGSLKDSSKADLTSDQEHIPIPVRSSSRQPHATSERREDKTSARAMTPAAAHSASSEETNTNQSRSRAGSASSYMTNATSLPPLQQKAPGENDQLDPLNEDDIDPGSFDLVAPADLGVKQYSLEKRSVQLFSAEHLKVIFNDPTILLRFTSFLSTHRVSSIPILIYYLDTIKALKALSYSNAIAEALEPIDGLEFTQHLADQSSNTGLEEKAKQAFDVLVREDLPAYVTHTYIQTVSLSISRKITGTLPAHLRQTSEGLAEVFCLTDPSRPDNPIVFASEEFHRTTQYGMGYVLGRNCRFLQGPKTNANSVRRLRENIRAGREHYEVFLNYRRDGSPFMNLLMCAPLCDARGTVRYFIGAQVDVSGLVKECVDFESLKRLVMAAEQAEAKEAEGKQDQDYETSPKKDEFQELSEMLNMQELDTVRRWGGRMHKEAQLDELEINLNGGNWNKPRLLINDISLDGSKHPQLGRFGGKLGGIYENYLLIRPYPSLRVLFASPTLRVPGILQSKFMDKIGGSPRVRDELTNALADGRGVTAKVRWVTKSDSEGRSRWIHCTPLLGSNGAIGVWMVVIVVEDSATSKQYKQAPPVDPRFGRTIPASSPLPNHRRGHDSGDDWSMKEFVSANREAVGNGNRPDSSTSSNGGSAYMMRID